MAKRSLDPSDKKPFLGLIVHNPVFYPSLIIVVLSVILALVFSEQAQSSLENAQKIVSDKTGWIYTIAVNTFIVFCLYMAFGKFGSIRIGGPQAKPEFKVYAWFAMLFSTGIGNGLVLFSIADPVRDFMNPPRLPANAPPGAIAQEAINFSFLHHGIHGWAIYSVIGLSLAYFTYNRKMPLTIRSAFYPLLGDRIYGWIGNLIDVVAVVATLFGLATTMGFGVGQINAGFTQVFGIPDNLFIQYLIILGITAIATLSVVSGVNKGIKFLSEMNVNVAVIIFILVLVLGPTAFIMKSYVQNIGSYLYHFIDLATWSGAYGTSSWHNNVTLMYWGWWASWSPFVGTFIARISRGRTIREFILGVLFLPALVTFLWFSAFGGTTMLGLMQGDFSLANAVNDNISTALYVFFEKFPFAIVLKILGMILICSFIITSADSGALVVDGITSGGDRKTPAIQRIIWASLAGLIAAALLTGGGLGTLQAAVTISGLPFAILLLLMCISLHMGIKEDLQLTEQRSKVKYDESYKAALRKLLEEENMLEEDDMEPGNNDKSSPKTINESNETEEKGGL